MASCSVASRKARLISLLGVMGSVLRVEFRMFSSPQHTPARHRSCRAACQGACPPARTGTSRPDCRHPARRCGATARTATHAMRAVAGEDHPAVAELVHAHAGRVDADPLESRIPSPAGRRLDRGITRSGFFSSSGSASQPSWKSMRQTSSGSRCSWTDWMRWNSGSNRNQRSVRSPSS